MPCNRRRPFSFSAWSFISTIVFISCLLPLPANAAVLAIDYGTEFIKASLMKPGVPFDVLLNRDSKRKIQSSVAWKGHDRLFGSDAFNIATRYPTDSFSYLKPLQGVYFESDAVSLYKKISSAELVPTARNSVAFRTSNGTEWTVEELIAMQLAYVKELAESVGTTNNNGVAERIHDVVLTVPAYFSQFERDAVADAIEIAGLRLLALINDGTAVAVNYAMTRTFDAKPEYHVIYDAGASGIRATVVSFTSEAPKSKSNGKDAGTQINVHGFGYDRQAGGTELDRRLRDILADDFEKKHSKSIRGDKRGMAKMWKEAGRVKAILSANSDARPTIESVAFDIDYRSTVTRAAFEKACEDLLPKFAMPIVDAIANAGLTMENITSVIMSGGHSRTPMVQAAVKAAVKDPKKIATNVNADEAAVLGAALYGASVSRQFRTKDIKVQDIGVYDIQVSYPGEQRDPDTPPKVINSLVLPSGSKVGKKKTMTLKNKKDDFGLKMSYKTSPGSGLGSELVEADITGVKEALANLTERGAIDPAVKVTVILSDSGFASVLDASVTGELKDESFTGKIKEFFAPSTSDTDDVPQTTEAFESSSGSESSSESGSSASSSSSPSATPRKLTAKEREELSTIALQLELSPLSMPALTHLEKREAREKLKAVDMAEAAKRRREEARNHLEGYSYRLRDLLDDATDSPFMKCSTADERETINKKLKETLAWLATEADSADTLTFRDKKDVLERLERPIQTRHKEIQEFPAALNNSQRINYMTRVFLEEARLNLTAEEEAGLPSKWTAEELHALEKQHRDHASWLNEWVEKQKSVKMNEDPVILTTEMRARAKTLEAQLDRLRRRPKPKVKKSSTASSSSTAEETKTPSADDRSESATTTTAPEKSAVPEAETTSTTTIPAGEHTRDEL